MSSQFYSEWRAISEYAIDAKRRRSRDAGHR
jgi:hypothetical protein